MERRADAVAAPLITYRAQLNVLLATPPVLSGPYKWTPAQFYGDHYDHVAAARRRLPTLRADLAGFDAARQDIGRLAATVTNRLAAVEDAARDLRELGGSGPWPESAAAAARELRRLPSDDEIARTRQQWLKVLARYEAWARFEPPYPSSKAHYPDGKGSPHDWLADAGPG